MFVELLFSVFVLQICKFILLLIHFLQLYFQLFFFLIGDFSPLPYLRAYHSMFLYSFFSQNEPFKTQPNFPKVTVDLNEAPRIVFVASDIKVD